MNIKLIEEGDDIVLKATQDIYHKIAKEEDTQIKKLMVDYAKEHNAEIRFIDEEKVKVIIDLGCKEYLKNYQSGYISKDKIREYKEALEWKRRQEIENIGMSMLGSAIDILNKLLEEN